MYVPVRSNAVIPFLTWLLAKYNITDSSVVWQMWQAHFILVAQGHSLLWDDVG